MSHYKLYYFNFRGRGELIRYVFLAAGVQFEDVRFEREDWPKYKAEAPFGQAPFLEVTENGQTFKISQSLAIARFLARKFNLAGESEQEKVEVDMYADQLLDLLNEMARAHFEKDDARKQEMQTKLQTETIPNNMKLFEAKLAKTNSGYLIGSGLTWLDLFLYALLEWLGENAEKVLAHFPLVKALNQKISGHPNIAKYLSTRPVTPL